MENDEFGVGEHWLLRASSFDVECIVVNNLVIVSRLCFLLLESEDVALWARLPTVWAISARHEEVMWSVQNIRIKVV